jgi:pimeloyl-ACP methyl ester carboxylesterase
MPTKFNVDTPVILLHGLGQDSVTFGTKNSISFIAIKTTLKMKGYTRIINPYYSTKGGLENSVEMADKAISEHVSKDEEVIMIGHSLGGLVALKLGQNGWKLKYAITIASPLKGTEMITYTRTNLPQTLEWMEQNLPTITTALKTPIWNDLIALKQKPLEKPEHPVTTISTGLANLLFDGRVAVEDTKLTDNDDHHHFSWSEHSAILADVRLLIKLGELL